MPVETEEPSGWDDFDRVIAALVKHRVDFMIVGGIAVIYHGYVRDTKDLDIFIRRTPENAGRTVAALEEAGFACPELKPEVFTVDNGIALGEPPVQVDILAVLPGVGFDEAWSRRETSVFGAQTVHYISVDDLIRNKKAVGRLRDLADVEQLESGRKQGRDKKPEPPA